MTGPVVPTPGAAAVVRPVPFDVDGGFWAERRRVNETVSIPHALARLAEHGQLDDLRQAAGRELGHHSGQAYNDSDVYKTAEALAWAGTDPATLADLAELVTAAQEKTGYVNSWFQRTGGDHFADLHLGHEMYCAGHLIQAAVAAARAGDDPGLLPAATAFADHLVDLFGGGTGLCGHPQIETALVELYRLTGRWAYLDLARRMVDDRGYGRLGPGNRGVAYYQDETPLREATELDGHCVRALYLSAGATDVYLETRDASLLPALVRLWEHTVATKTYITGGVGCRRRTEAFGAAYELPPDQAFNETCAGVANVMWSWRLLLATGASRYADHMERVLYNVVAAGVSLSGDRFSYINPLQRRGFAMEHGDKAPYRKDWFRCPCCPPNVMRLLASLGHYVATVDRDGLTIQQYASGTVHTGELELAVHTNYPWAGEVAIEVRKASAPAELRLRVPGWCDDWTLTVNGEPEVGYRDGYAVTRRACRPGDRVELNLAMPPRYVWPDRRVDAVRGCVAVERGPLVYCFEESDLPDGVALEDLVVDTGVPLRTEERPDLLGGVVAVRAAGRRYGDDRPAWPYRDRAPTGSGSSELTLTAIPYHRWDNRARGEMRTWIPG